MFFIVADYHLMKKLLVAGMLHIAVIKRFLKLDAVPAISWSKIHHLSFLYMFVDLLISEHGAQFSTAGVNYPYQSYVSYQDRW